MLKLATLLALIGCVLSSPVSATEESRPNILFILVDDLGYADLGCQGSKEIRTPHIDGLAASGLRFTDAYVTAPQCGPSRAGIMTGVHQARFGYLDNKDNHGLPDPQILPLMPEYLKQAGYRTGLVGKWHIGQGTEAMLNKTGARRIPRSEERETFSRRSGSRPPSPGNGDSMKGSFSLVAAATTFLSARNSRTIRVPITSPSMALIGNLNPTSVSADCFQDRLPHRRGH